MKKEAWQDISQKDKDRMEYSFGAIAFTCASAALLIIGGMVFDYLVRGLV